MPTTLSPLRYPGGKTVLYERVSAILEHNELTDVTYIEPFAGGCGLAIKLLLNNNVSNVVINDVDSAIYSFWHSVLFDTYALCAMLKDCEITIEERNRQISVLQCQNGHSVLEIGFATLFVNRTSVSGILTAGPIGGKDQLGKDKLDARFKKKDILEKIDAIAAASPRIVLHNLDAIDFIDQVLPDYAGEEVFLNFDPPYVNKGQELYLNHYRLDDHIRLSEKIADCEHPWIVTYDHSQTILDLYRQFRYERITLNHSAGNMKKGQEVVIFSNGLRLPGPTAAN